ncbi:MAG TPA: hypothetical protein VMI31_16870 [Fimbriimonadaceae bacterium]|nr:hypothetical protein [Fimbriimonadaceae bacterium]
MKYGYLVAAVALAAVVQRVSAFSDSETSSSVDFQFGFTNPSQFSFQLDTGNGGEYMNFPATSSGDGVNYGNATNRTFDGVNSGMVSQACGSSTAVNGSAKQFEGMASFFIVTNTSGQDATFSLSETITQMLTSIGDADTLIGSGFIEFENNGIKNYSEMDSELFGDGSFTNTVYGGNYITGGNVSPGHFSGTTHFSDTLQAGESVQVEVYTAGITHVETRTADTPEPVTMSLGAASVVAFLVRRRKRNLAGIGRCSS